MNTSVQANAVSPKVMRGALAHNIGISPNCDNETDPAALKRISSTKKPIIKASNTKNRTDKNTVKTLVKALFSSVTNPEKVRSEVPWFKFPLTLPNAEDEEQLDLEVNQTGYKDSDG